MPGAATEIVLPRRLAVALYGAAQAAPERVVRGVVRRGRAGLVFMSDTEHSDDPVFAAFRSQPEGATPPDRNELERLTAQAPLLLVVSRATRGVMVLTGFRYAGATIEALPVRIEDAEKTPV
jgi:hypothetical protein